MGLIESIGTLITEHGSSAVLKERLELIRDQLQQLQSENTGLKKSITELKAENFDLSKKLKSLTVSTEFVEYRGTLWKRESPDTVEPYPYCRKCKSVMHDFAHVQWVCGGCNSSTPLVNHPEAAKG